METEPLTEKSQVGDKKKPVRWVVLLSQDLTQQIENYAQKYGIAEVDVFKKALLTYLSKPRKLSRHNLRGADGVYISKR